ncbi:hypothetical protein FA13DRAFT_1710715 [Coprinellus micaceus]|uniref:Uncharacterized protein n=1 Tax=Coprinellus micaceus TaxID=71717 RepID=A0A4Y7T6R1_COPMI|nr:hypothetical protein FA13DRAFT_1710715 [Coprinellus micaceus]
MNEPICAPQSTTGDISKLQSMSRHSDWMGGSVAPVSEIPVGCWTLVQRTSTASSQEAVGPNAKIVGTVVKAQVLRCTNTRQFSFGRVFNGAGHGPTACQRGPTAGPLKPRFGVFRHEDVLSQMAPTARRDVPGMWAENSIFLIRYSVTLKLLYHTRIHQLMHDGSGAGVRGVGMDLGLGRLFFAVGS